jgi:hypothetical protein
VGEGEVLLVTIYRSFVIYEKVGRSERGTRIDDLGRMRLLRTGDSKESAKPRSLQKLIATDEISPLARDQQHLRVFSYSRLTLSVRM